MAVLQPSDGTRTGRVGAGVRGGARIRSRGCDQLSRYFTAIFMSRFPSRSIATSPLADSKVVRWALYMAPSIAALDAGVAYLGRARRWSRRSLASHAVVERPREFKSPPRRFVTKGGERRPGGPFPLSVGRSMKTLKRVLWRARNPSDGGGLARVAKRFA